MKPSQFITAKELAPHLEMNHFKVLRLEVKLGLKECRDPNFEKPVRWFRNKALLALLKAGYQVEF